MKESFDKAFDFVIGVEGGITDDPNDPGGLTKYGVSDLRDGVKDGRTDTDGDKAPDKDIRSLTLDEAKAIYRRDYWDACNCDDLPCPLDIVVFDTAVNMGCARAMAILSKTSAESPVDYLIIRAGEYAKIKSFNLYGRGWINRLVKLYDTFLSEGS